MLFIKLIIESFLMAVHSVAVNKLRTLLTLSGITIGIFAIISVFTVVDALESGIRDNIASLGDNVVYVQKWPWSFESDYKWWDYYKRPVPKIAEYEDVVHKSQTVDIAAFSVSTRRDVSYKKRTYKNGGVWANTQEFNQIRSFEIEQGRYFSAFEANSGKNLCLIGSNIVKDLFEFENPLGKEIKIDGHKIKIVGIVKKEGSGIFGGSLDDLVLLPMNYARKIFDVRSENLEPFIMVRAKPNVSLEQMKDELTSILRKKRMLRPSQADNFALNQASMIMKGMEQIFVILNIAGWIIGGFSILVGGFGIANIMFVSVRERTNQIGIQLALGAKRYFVLFQFLFEAIMLAIAGGIFGLLFVFMGTALISSLSDFKISLTLANIFMGITTSAIIGLIAGMVPAYMASKLNPVEAINTTF